MRLQEKTFSNNLIESTIYKITESSRNKEGKNSMTILMDSNHFNEDKIKELVLASEAKGFKTEDIAMINGNYEWSIKWA